MILLRHGRTVANAEGRLQGRIDHPLDEVGLEQARRCADRLATSLASAVVVTSPLVRAVQTAEALGVQAVVDERFVELDYGVLDGLAVEDVPAETWARWRSDPTFRPPDGESLVDLDLRVRPALEEWGEVSRERDVIVVSHVSPIKSAVTWALGVGPEASWRCSLDRASITRISVGSRGPTLVGFNDIDHLGHTAR